MSKSSRQHDDEFGSYDAATSGEAPSGLDEARRRIAIAVNEKAEELDLGGLGLVAVPEGLLAANLSHLKILHLGLPKEIAEKSYEERTSEDKKICNAVSALPLALFASLPHLTHLHLDNNLLATLPAAIGQLASLQELHLDNNQLTALPAAIGQLASLQELYLNNNQLAALPEAIGQLASLQQLYLNNNQLTALPAAIGQLASLQVLWLDSNQLTALPNSIGKLAHLHQLRLSFNQLAELPDTIGQLTKLGELRLRHNQLTALPDGIGRLANLKVLCLASNQLALPDAIGQLTGLQKLNLEHNQLVALPDAIGQLASLKELRLNNNRLTALPDAIGQLKNLRELLLDYNQLAVIPAAIGKLAGLRILDLDNNDLATLPDAIGQLALLYELRLTSNQLTELPDAIGELANLQDIQLNNNLLTRLPPTFGKLHSLKSIWLHNNQLAELPDSIGGLRNLQELRLSKNQLTALPDSIGKLVSLRSVQLDSNLLVTLPDTIGKLESVSQIWLNNNQLTALPEGIGQLKSLNQLFLGSNQLAALPDGIGKLESLEELSLDNNQLTALPPMLGANGKLNGEGRHGNARFSVRDNPLPVLPEGLAEHGHAVLDFLKGLREGAEPSNEIKTMLVGEPKAGKTSLYYRLKDNTFDKNRTETVGLEIGAYEIEPIDGRWPRLRLNIWDFGGQDEYRSTQQFFFTRRALYVFLWERRLNLDESKLRRWISLINKRAGAVKVLMVATHCYEDGRLREHGLRAHELREIEAAYPGMILPEVMEIDSADPAYHIEELKERLYREAWALRHKYEMYVPTSWMAARDRILARNETHIDFATFEAECTREGVTGSAVRTLALLLSNQGRLVYYGDDKRLSDTVVLKAEWLMKAFAAVRQDKVADPETLPETERPARVRKGFLHRDRLSTIWTGDYANKHDLLLRLMIHHGLSYQVTADEWLVPELVPEREPDRLPWHAGDPADGGGDDIRQLVQFCHLGTDYDEQHDLSIIPGLIAAITQRSNYYYVDRNRFWQEGLSVRHPKHQTDALITMAGRRVLRMETRGRFLGGMMDEMRGVIENVIHDRWPAAREASQPLYEFRVPCSQEGCAETILVSTLMEAERQRKETFPCPRGHDNSVSQLLRGLRPSELTLREDIAVLRDDVGAVSKKVDQTLSVLQRMSSDLIVLQSLNADAKQCLNFLVGSATSRLPPRIYALTPVDFDFNDPKPILGSALRPREVRLTIWCEQENRPVSEASVTIEIDTALVRAIKARAPAAVKILSVAIALWSGVPWIDSVSHGKVSGVLEFMLNLFTAADDIVGDRAEVGLGHDVDRKHSLSWPIERHSTADELDEGFAAKLREAAKQGAMEQVFCQDGQWRWVSKEAARRLSPTEPRELISPSPKAIERSAPNE